MEWLLNLIDSNELLTDSMFGVVSRSDLVGQVRSGRQEAAKRTLYTPLNPRIRVSVQVPIGQWQRCTRPSELQWSAVTMPRNFSWLVDRFLAGVSVPKRPEQVCV